MPYIKQEDRDRLAKDYIPRNVGELNYFLTVAIDYYWRTNGKNYQAINDVLGALDGASKEFYRRVAAPYEDTKIAENGDVYYAGNEGSTGQTAQGTPSAQPHSKRPTLPEVHRTDTGE